MARHRELLHATSPPAPAPVNSNKPTRQQISVLWPNFLLLLHGKSGALREELGAPSLRRKHLAQESGASPVVPQGCCVVTAPAEGFLGGNP